MESDSFAPPSLRLKLEKRKGMHSHRFAIGVKVVSSPPPGIKEAKSRYRERHRFSLSLLSPPPHHSLRPILFSPLHRPLSMNRGTLWAEMRFVLKTDASLSLSLCHLDRSPFSTNRGWIVTDVYLDAAIIGTVLFLFARDTRVAIGMEQWLTRVMAFEQEVTNVWNSRGGSFLNFVEDRNVFS